MYRFLLIASILIVSLFNSEAQEKKFSFTREKMASPFTIVLYDNDPVHAVYLAEECFTLVDSFVNIFSDYIDTSELSILNKSAGSHTWMPVSPALFDIISISQIAYKKSKGAFDITMGPIIRLWRRARKEKDFPRTQAISEKMKTVGFKKLKINIPAKLIQLTTAGMQLDLGGIAQGYIAQKVLERLVTSGTKHALIDVSGDIATTNPPPGKKGWTIGVDLPGSDKLQTQLLQIAHKAVSTSGDFYQFIEHDGKRYSHIIDPSTGYGITMQKNVTVIAGDAITADWLSTACSVLSIKKAKRLALHMHAEVLIAVKQNDKIVQYTTKKFNQFYYSNNRND